MKKSLKTLIVGIIVSILSLTSCELTTKIDELNASIAQQQNQLDLLSKQLEDANSKLDSNNSALEESLSSLSSRLDSSQKLSDEQIQALRDALNSNSQLTSEQIASLQAALSSSSAKSDEQIQALRDALNPLSKIISYPSGYDYSDFVSFLERVNQYSGLLLDSEYTTLIPEAIAHAYYLYGDTDPELVNSWESEFTTGKQHFTALVKALSGEIEKRKSVLKAFVSCYGDITMKYYPASNHAGDYYYFVRLGDSIYMVYCYGPLFVCSSVSEYQEKVDETFATFARVIDIYGDNESNPDEKGNNRLTLLLQSYGHVNYGNYCSTPSGMLAGPHDDDEPYTSHKDCYFVCLWDANPSKDQDSYFSGCGFVDGKACYSTETLAREDLPYLKNNYSYALAYTYSSSSVEGFRSVSIPEFSISPNVYNQMR